MNVLVFGATGQTGRAVVELALEQGHSVTAFVRNPAGLASILDDQPHQLNVIQGDAVDYESVRHAMLGDEVVISTLSARTLDPNPGYVEAAHNVIRACEDAGIRRLVYCLSVGIFFEQAEPKFEHVVRQHKAIRDILAASSLEWVGICPPTIKDEPAHGSYQTMVGGATGTWTISRYDLAAAMLAQTGEDAAVGQLVSVSN